MESAMELSAMLKVASSPCKRRSDNKLNPSSLFGHSRLSALCFL